MIKSLFPHLKVLKLEIGSTAQKQRFHLNKLQVWHLRGQVNRYCFYMHTSVICFRTAAHNVAGLLELEARDTDLIPALILFLLYGLERITTSQSTFLHLQNGDNSINLPTSECLMMIN